MDENTENIENTPLLGDAGSIRTARSSNRAKSRKLKTWQKLVSYCFVGILFTIAFKLVFLPRTSLARDLKRIHYENLTKADIKRIFLVQDESFSHSFQYDGLVDYYRQIGYSAKDIAVQDDNVILKIPGIFDTEAIIMGTDAVNKNESAASLHVANRFKHLLQLGWKPLRSIYFINWGAESGISAYVQRHSNKRFLKSNVLTYIELKQNDFATEAAGNEMRISINCNPLLEDTCYRTKEQVAVKEQHKSEDLVGVLQSKASNAPSLLPMEAEFGIPSVEIDMRDEAEKYVEILTKYVGMLLLNIDEKDVIDFKISRTSGVVSDKLSEILQNYSELHAEWLHDDEYARIMTNLQNSANHFAEIASKTDTEIQRLQDAITRDFPWYQMKKKFSILLEMKILNYRLKYVNKAFVHHDTYLLQRNGVFLYYLQESFNGADLGSAKENADNLVSCLQKVAKLLSI